MTPKQKKEELSKAYIYAVAAKSGFKLGNWTQDDDCLDVTVAAAGVLGGGTLGSPKLDIQIKCTSQERVQHDGFVSWPLSAAHYDILRARAANPKILVVLVLPIDEADWVTHSVDSLIMRRCAFWTKMTGLPPATTDSISVQLPETQPFSPDQLRAMMERLSREEDL